LTVATVVYVYEISWARIKIISQTNSHPFRWAFVRLIAGWIIFVVGTKTIQLSLNFFLPNLDLWPLGLTGGGSLTALTIALLVVVPALIAVCLLIAVLRAMRNKENRKDIWLVLGFVGALAVNLQMTYTLQLAFPGASLVYLVAFPTLLPLGMLLVYLTRPVTPDGVSRV
jgi:hypothetical protein